MVLLSISYRQKLSKLNYEDDRLLTNDILILIDQSYQYFKIFTLLLKYNCLFLLTKLW